MSAHIWAPEIHFIDGKWYVYFTASRADAIWEVRPYVLVNDSADPFKGEWKELGASRPAGTASRWTAPRSRTRANATSSGRSAGARRKRAEGTNIYIAADELAHA